MMNESKKNNQGLMQDRVESQAIYWFVQLQDESVSDDVLREFDRWLEASSAHREAYLEIDLLRDSLTALADTQQGREIKAMVIKEVETKGGFFDKARAFFDVAPKWASTALSVCAVVILTWFFVETKDTSLKDIAIEQQRIKNTQNTIKSLSFSDGTSVVLGAQSELVMNFEENRRVALLLNGEAFFDVATDFQKPFFVTTDDMSVKVVGTQFDVRKMLSRTLVGVVEGVVNVYSSSLESIDAQTRDAKTSVKELVLVAGQQANLTAQNTISVDSNISLVDLASWREGRLVYSRAELQDVISDANRYFGGKDIVVIGDDDLLKEAVTLSLNISEISTLPNMLAQLFAVELTESDSQMILTQR